MWSDSSHILERRLKHASCEVSSAERSPESSVQRPDARGATPPVSHIESMDKMHRVWGGRETHVTRGPRGIVSSEAPTSDSLRLLSERDFESQHV